MIVMIVLVWISIVPYFFSMTVAGHGHHVKHQSFITEPQPAAMEHQWLILDIIQIHDITLLVAGSTRIKMMFEA